MTISDTGLALIKSFEGCRLTAYRDAAGVLTIGYGWTKAIDGRPLTIKTTITQEKAERLLKEGLKSYEANVNKYDDTYHWNQNQFDALVSFCYNIGTIDGLTANGTRSATEIAAKFTAYDKAGGKTLPGLTARRNKEKQLFLTPAASHTSNSNTLHSASGYSHTAFVKDVQTALGAKADGIAGAETLSKTVTVSKSKNNRHPVVKPIQKYLYAVGYTSIGAADGVAGAKFDTAVRAYQKANKCVIDGEITAKAATWKKLLKIC